MGTGADSQSLLHSLHLGVAFAFIAFRSRFCIHCIQESLLHSLHSGLGGLRAPEEVCYITIWSEVVASNCSDVFAYERRTCEITRFIKGKHFVGGSGLSCTKQNFKTFFNFCENIGGRVSQPVDHGPLVDRRRILMGHGLTFLKLSRFLKLNTLMF